VTKILVIDDNTDTLNHISDQIRLMFPESSVLTAQSDGQGIDKVKPFLRQRGLTDMLDVIESSEAALQRRTAILDKRVKELNCLYSISEILESNVGSLKDILFGIVRLIPPALRYPKLASARITFDNEEFRTNNFTQTRWQESFAIPVYGVPMGTVQACYLKSPKNGEDVFLEEERLLLDNIARRAGKIIERKLSEENLIRLNRALDMLSECRNTLFYYNNEFKLAEKICRIIVEKGGYTMAWVGYAQEGLDKSVRPICRWGYEEQFLDSLNITWDNTENGQGPMGTAIRTGKSAVFRNIVSDPRFSPWRDEAMKRGYASAVGLPLCSEDRCIGGLSIYASESDAFDAAEIELLMGLADDMAYGITAIRTRLERSRSREFLIESEKRYRTLFNSASDAIFVCHCDGQFIDVNRKACELLGYSREALIEMTMDDICKKTQCDPRQFEALSDDKNMVIETEYIRQDGAEVPVEANTRKIRHSNDMAILTIARDISERRRAEEEKNKLWRQLQEAQKRQALGTMAGGIAHDFNNILFPIMGYIEMTMDELPEDSKGKKQLAEAMKGAKRARELVQHILTFSRNTGQEFISLTLQPLIKETLKLIRATLPANIRIRQNIDISCGTILANPTQIHQVLMNLCTNAWHAMREKGGTLEVALKEVRVESDSGLELRPNNYLRLTISDTGHGMTREVMERIFDPYFTTKKPGEGTGLGLAVVFGIVRSCKGQIQVYSEPDIGTTFHVYLPRIESGQDAGFSDKIPEPICGGVERILLIDDEEPIILMLAQMLEKLGYHVIAQKDSVEALELFRSQSDKFDLVITDQSMPNLSGDQLAVKLKEIRADIPIALCSGFSDMLTRERAKQSGIDYFIMKPVIKRELAETLRQILDVNRKDNCI
jgi:PAS domain S-box-containing protein